jgi:GMP synthase (glutamine-hydrolysing)
MIAAAKPFLILQLRPETPAADNEFEAFLDKGGLEERDTIRVRLERDPLPDDLDLDNLSGVIVGGGPGCVSDAPGTKSPEENRIEQAVFSLMPEITARDVPFLGCCYGIGVLAHHLGAPVTKERYSEPVGPSECTLTADGANDPLLDGFPQTFSAFVGHKEAVQQLPEGCAHLVASAPCPFQMIRHGRNVYATQFHPELDSKGLEVRINIYKHRGYFAPEQADALIAKGHATPVRMPEVILKRFVDRYRKAS